MELIILFLVICTITGFYLGIAIGTNIRSELEDENFVLAVENTQLRKDMRRMMKDYEEKIVVVPLEKKTRKGDK